MSFRIFGLGPTDQGYVTQLSPLIVSTLRKASAEIGRGQGLTECSRWFGDTSAPWLKRLGTALNRMASVVNIEDIDVSFRSLNHRKGSFAAASQPGGGWGTYTSVKDARGQGFRIQLDTAWNKAPLLRPLGAPADSMFQTLVHELAHLVLHAEDHEYGVPSCLALAQNSSYKAKDNADNWGYFVEEFR